MTLNAASTKSLFTSVTFWGAVVSGLATFAPNLFQALGLGTDSNSQIILVQHIIQIVGFLVTVYGRLRATQKVTILPSAPATPPTTPNP